MALEVRLIGNQLRCFEKPDALPFDYYFVEQLKRISVYNSKAIVIQDSIFILL